jgi:cytochrome P450
MLDALHNLLNSFARRGQETVFDLRAELTLFAAEFTLRLTLGDDARTFNVEEALRIRDHNGQLYNAPAVWDSVPWLGKTLLRKARKRYADSYRKAADPYRPIMRKRLLHFDPDAEARDYLDVLLQHVKRGELNEDQVATMLASDFFIAGTDTATAALEWIIGLLFQAPSEKLERLQKELDELHAPITSLLTQDDLTPERVPYLYAVIKETFR